MQAEVSQVLAKIAERLENVLETKEAVTLVLDDPAGNSYIQVSSLC